MNGRILIPLAIFVSTTTFADVTAYQANRMLLTDCRLDPLEVEETGGPEVQELAELFTGQSCQFLDERDVEGELVVWTQPFSNVVDTMSYRIRACLPCEDGADEFLCTRQCYTFSDDAVATGYTWDGRQYSMDAKNGDDYLVHWIRRETKPTSGDPAAIFQISFTHQDRSLNATFFYRINQ